VEVSVTVLTFWRLWPKALDRTSLRIRTWSGKPYSCLVTQGQNLGCSTALVTGAAAHATPSIGFTDVSFTPRVAPITSCGAPAATRGPDRPFDVPAIAGGLTQLPPALDATSADGFH
jgi:hypothetical protein